VAGYSGDAGDAMAAAATPLWNANGMMFSTEDVDNDIAPRETTHCGRMGGWWHAYCSISLLNKDPDGAWWAGARETAVYDVRYSRMLVKLN